MLKKDKTLLLGLFVSGDFGKLEDNDDLIHYMNHVKVDVNQHRLVKAPSHDGTFLVIFNDISTLFPFSNNISGKDWTEICDTATAVPPQVLDLALTTISTTLQAISDRGKEKKDLEDMKNMIINVTALPNDAQKIYLQQRNRQ